MRKNKIAALSESSAIDILRKKGYLEPFDVTCVYPSYPTANQIEICKEYGIDIPENSCKDDVSEILSCYFENDHRSPSADLIKFATNRNILFSTYIGKKRLYDKVFNSLEPQDRIAFFIFSIYRYLSDDRRGNLDEHPYINIFYDFARDHVGDKDFLSSLSMYRGRDLRFFGELSFTDNYPSSYKGGRTDLYAYKSAKEYLIDTGLISGCESEHKVLPGEYTSINTQFSTMQVPCDSSRDNIEQSRVQHQQKIGCIVFILLNFVLVYICIKLELGIFFTILCCLFFSFKFIFQNM